jgi:hypothetical protein
VPPNGGKPRLYSLGPHPPRLWADDIHLVHRLWQELSNRPGIGSRLHHRDVVSVALRRLNEQLHSGERHDVLHDVEHELNRKPTEQAEPSYDTEEESEQHDLNPT